MLTIDHKHCTGCGSCIEACPQLAVSKTRDKYKFVYPSVDSELCRNCGRCTEVCPLRKPLTPPAPMFETVYYAAKASEKNTLLDSHAGGVFPLLAREILAKGGAVYGCAFDENRHPRHIRVTDTAELPRLQGLKPVQSDTDGIYAMVRDDVEQGIAVLFAGTPCECDGLRCFLGRDYDNLIVTDMLCGGVTSEGIFNRYVNWLEQRLGGRIQELRFENKRAFGQSRALRMVYKRGTLRYLLSVPAEWDVLYAMHQQGYVHRRSCGTCPYATPVRTGDISLGRFEKIRRAHPEFPYDNGASLVIVSSEKGMALFTAAAGHMVCEPSDLTRASANRRLTRPIRENRHRAKLLSDIYRHGFAKAAKNFGSIGIWASAAALVTCAIPDRAVIGFDRAVKKTRETIGRLLSPKE